MAVSASPPCQVSCRGIPVPDSETPVLIDVVGATTVGAVRSTLVVSVNGAAGPGSVNPSTDPAARVRESVPAVGAAARTSTAYEAVPEVPPTAFTAHPVEVPPIVKSPTARPVTPSVNQTQNC